MFDKNQYLWLDWEEPTPLNIVALAVHFVLGLIIFLWLAVWIAKLLPWPSF